MSVIPPILIWFYLRAETLQRESTLI